MSLAWLFLDFNSYFASVEQLHSPELRGRPIGVAAGGGADGACCIAVSAEAKRFGVRTGTRVFEARRLCPEIVIAPARHSLYVRTHHRLVEAIEKCVPVTSVHSVDEVSCRLLGAEREPSNAVALAEKIKRTIAREVGPEMRCSIGLAPSRLLAKLGTDMQKPDGLVVIHKHELPHRLFGLQLTDFCGIGPRMAARLRARGVHSVEQLCGLSRREMERIWESYLGWKWHLILRGEDPDQASAPALSRHRSVGHQHVLPPDLREPEKARAVAHRLASKAAARMRAMGYQARQIHLSVALEPLDARARRMPRPGPGEQPVGTWGNAGRWRSRVHAHADLGHGSADTLRLLGEVNALWDRLGLSPRTTERGFAYADPAPTPEGGTMRPVFVDVTLGGLVAQGSATLPLFESERRRSELSAALDKINDRYGRNAVYTAAQHGVRDAARGGVAFASIPDLDIADTVA
jgi:DNA polymerase-4